MFPCLLNIRPFPSELSLKRAVKISHKPLITYYEFLILFLTSRKVNSVRHQCETVHLYMLSSSTTNAIIQGHPGDPEWSKYSSCYPPMISTIFNELIVQIVSDFFPKPKAPPGVIMSITVHKPSPRFSFLPFQLPCTKHKHQFNRHFCSFLLSKPAFKQTKSK